MVCLRGKCKVESVGDDQFSGANARDVVPVILHGSAKVIADLEIIGDIVLPGKQQIDVRLRGSDKVIAK